MNSNKIARKLRVRIARFSGDLSEGLCKRAKAFVGEMVYGMQASGSVLLTEAGRALEEGIPLRKTQYRLSRNLMRPELEGILQQNVLRLASRRIGEDTLLIIDPSDITKKYAKKMEFLGTVRDGSAQELGTGYWTLHIIGAEVGSTGIIPLYQRLWSCAAPGFESENEEILRGVDAVMKHVGHKGVFVMDRGGDRINLFAPLLDRQARFFIRLLGNRNLIYNRKTLLANEIARTCPCPYRQTIVRIKNGREKVYELQFGCRKVKLPKREEPLYLMVVHGFGKAPALFLTNEPLRNSYKCLFRWVQAYTKRWAIEETIRYVKTCYDLENVRVLNYQGLQNLMALLLAVMYFTACILDHDQRLRIMAHYVEAAAKRLFGVPDFKYYALADGLSSLFKRHPGQPHAPARAPNNPQLELLLAYYA